MGEARLQKPKIGISACLLGNEVRYDGGHKRNVYVTGTLSEHFDFTEFCPEVAIGLSIPRPPIHLAENGDSGIRAIKVKEPDVDFTDALAGYADSFSSKIEPLSGIVVKKDSPSCGMERVKVYGKEGAPPERRGAGIFTGKIQARFPYMPVEEEGRLSDPRLRENFIVRVFTMHRWHQMVAEGLSPAALVKFHSRHKFLIQAHHEVLYRELGRMVADAGKRDMDELGPEYLSKLMEALSKKTSPGKCANVLTHIMGFINENMTADEKQEVLGLIDDHRNGLVPLVVPITLINHFLRKYPHEYIDEQYFLEPHPREMMLRNHI